MEIKKGKKTLKFGAACLPVEFLAEKYNFLFGLESVNLLIKDFAVCTGQIVSKPLDFTSSERSGVRVL